MDERTARKRVLEFAEETLRNYKRLQADLGDTNFHTTEMRPYFSIGIFPDEGRVHVDGVDFEGKKYHIDISEKR